MISLGTDIAWASTKTKKGEETITDTFGLGNLRATLHLWLSPAYLALQWARQWAFGNSGETAGGINGKNHLTGLFAVGLNGYFLQGRVAVPLEAKGDPLFEVRVVAKFDPL